MRDFKVHTFQDPNDSQKIQFHNQDIVKLVDQQLQLKGQYDDIENAFERIMH